METIKEAVHDAHKNAKEKGFYDLPESILSKMNLALFSLEEISAVRDAFIAQRLMLITSELGEALEANRKNRKANLEEYVYDSCLPNSNFQEDFERNIKDSFSDELADTAIRLFDLAGWLNIDLQRHVELKHKYNTTRSKMHGGKKY